MPQVESVPFWRNRCSVTRCKSPAYRAERCRFHYEQHKAVETRATAEREAVKRRYHPGDSQDCFVYAVRSENGLVKIGSAKDPKSRMNYLQGQSPVRVKLTLLGFIGGSRSLERLIHSRLSDYREHGEWFRYEGAAKSAIECIVSGDGTGLAEIMSGLLEKDLAARSQTG